MSTEVQFDEDSMSNASRIQAMRGGAGSEQSAMIRWIMNHGLAKTPVAAQGVLIGVIVVNVILAILVIKYLL